MRATTEKPSATCAGYLSEIFLSYQGEGSRAGEKHLFVRFAGCHLRCVYCDTPASLVRSARCEIDYPDGSAESVRNPITPGRLATIVERFLRADPNIAMIAITGGEPMLQHRFIARWLGGHRPPVPCLLETSGLLSEGLDELSPQVAVISADVKLPSCSGEGSRWDEHRRFFEACAGLGASEVYVKMPVDDATSVGDVRRGARLVAQTLPQATLFMQPVTDASSGKWRLSTPRLMKLLGCASAELPRTRLRPQLHKLTAMR